VMGWGKRRTANKSPARKGGWGGAVN
jgi:hypothetical protein